MDEYDVPFCDTCLERKRSEQSPLSAWTPVRRILSEAEGLAGFAVMGIALMFFSAAVRTLSLRQPGSHKGKSLFHVGDFLAFLDALACQQGSGVRRGETPAANIAVAIVGNSGGKS